MWVALTRYQAMNLRYSDPSALAAPAGSRKTSKKSLRTSLLSQTNQHGHGRLPSSRQPGELVNKFIPSGIAAMSKSNAAIVDSRACQC
jgi:hypothetical protein